MTFWTWTEKIGAMFIPWNMLICGICSRCVKCVWSWYSWLRYDWKTIEFFTFSRQKADIFYLEASNVASEAFFLRFQPVNSRVIGSTLLVNP
jgi:hypothetical protein